MNTGEVYAITLGRYSDKYLVTGNFNGTRELRRVRLPKTKIDSVRLPERISIQYFGQPIKPQKKLSHE